MSSRTSHAFFVGEDFHAVCGGLGAGDRASLYSFLAVDGQSEQCSDLAAELDGLIGAEVTEVLDLDLTFGVLIDGEGIDHAHSVTGAQALQLGDDLPVEIWLLKA